MQKKTLKAALRATVLAFGLQGVASAQALTVDLVESGFASPLYVTSPTTDFDRVFVVEQGGRIWIIENGVRLATPFLNVDPLTNGGGERGLLGMAFHPDYENNGRFFISYTDLGGDSQVVEYAVSAADPNIANSTPVQTIFSQNQPFSNHNGGCIAFGGDGMLYLGLGDGGSANDPQNRSQNPVNNHGKMHRFDVDITAPFIPADNPFVGDPSTNDSIWSLGLRNPFRFSFDMATGDLYIGDVGQNSREEVDYQPGTSAGGENYGWRCMEGFNCTGLTGCTCMAATLTDPIHDYPTPGANCAVTGGFVYQSDEIPALKGTYFFADFCSSSIWSFRVVGGAMTEFTNRTAELEPEGSLTINNIPSFGQDAAGNVYICDFGGGEIYKIVGDCDVDNYCTATANSSGNPAAISSNGTPSLGDNDFDLLGRNLPGGVFGLFFYGPTQVQVAFGDGFRCVGGMTFRVPPLAQADALGNVVRMLDLNAPPVNSGPGMITSGSSWNFQLWFRDPMGPGGTGFNLTDGLSVVFCP